jgi:type IV pilus assembly protein PilN
MPRINLLPWREQQRRERKLSFFVSLGAAAVGALVATFAGYLVFQQQISAQEGRNERLRGEIKVLDTQIQEINNLESQKQRFIGRMQVIDKLQRSRSEIVHMFDEVANMVPDGVYLTSFKQANRRLRFDGVAQSSTRVSTFLRNIDSSQWVKNSSLAGVESKQGQTNGNSFVVYADQVATAEDEADSAKAAAAKRTRRVSGATP